MSKTHPFGWDRCPNCGEYGAHFAPPSCGEPGFFICEEVPDWKKKLLVEKGEAGKHTEWSLGEEKNR